MFEVIDQFWNENRFLSNFYPSNVWLGNLQFPSVENAYQASKTLNLFERAPFTDCTAGQAKRLGSKLKIRDDWEEVKLKVMRGLLDQKFCDPILREKLIETAGIQLIEGNTWGDKFWGAVLDAEEGPLWELYDDDDVQRHRWVGQNHLGRMLMDIRTKILCEL